jgi:chromatin remodeling complex protein RSC6
MESKVTKKQTKTAAVATPAPAAAPVVAAVATPAPATKKAAAKVAEPVATPAPVAAAPAVEAPKKTKKASVAAPSDATSVATGTTVAPSVGATEATAEVDVHERLESLANDMIKMAKQFLEASRQARKEHARVVKKAEQGGKRRHRKTSADGETSHSNSVFLQPCKVSPALATFCGVAADSMISRTDATRAIAAYIKKHNLQNPDNRREIRADATLTKLFALGAEDKLNYFNLQKFIKPHFIKEVKA